MNANNKKENFEDVLKEANEKIQPVDSWEALRERIDEKIESRKVSSGFVKRLNGNLAFWRRTALAAAACLAITSVLLVSVIFNSHNNDIAGNHNLLAKDQIKQLSEAFSQVQDLFNQNCPWIVINSSGQGEIGDENQEINVASTKKIIVLRLAVNLNKNQSVPQYLDVVTFNNQLVSFNIPVKDNSNMEIALRPVITANNSIEVEIDTQLNSGPKITNTVTLADDSFKALARVKSNGNWININATGQSLSKI